ncbi:MAG: aminomethyl-transferring glycine dehydrogenase subunit GcvPA, partial [Candidatus Thermoplasmatota archaeon]
GAGLYDHFIPSAVRAIVSRSEFYSAYTPYQAELSQGILQALFEYQSMVCELTGMDAANTSMYDGSTALGEAALMAARVTGKREIVVPRALHWERRQVLENYVRGPKLWIRQVPFDRETGKLDLAALQGVVSDETAAVYVENPNFFGVFDDQVDEIRQIAPTLLIVGANPLSLAVARAPGDYGADIVIGEGQPLGNPIAFGGPLLGVFACREEYIRRMPGRVIGMTKDADGRRAFCMTMQSREQHIRREKAMSNICTNETLLSVASVAYVAVLGANGLRRLAEENVERARELAARIARVPGFEAPAFRADHFNEFVVRSERPYGDVSTALLKAGVHGGLPLDAHFPEVGQAGLFATTDAHRPEDRDRLVAALEAVR